eukprot:TRINITY_DN3369_c0_g1_i2.p2 TRINITY_DN3369_c0_g1~~TRINITY_DN3369_c0_g1_i2.p2  ORF type:complete len:334 (-),score=116.40 TRINITY_DN3369_c0_g1_i2:379-1380(-)
MRMALPVLTLLAVSIYAVSAYVTGTPADDLALMTRLNVGGGLFNHLLARKDDDEPKSDTERDLEERFKDYDIAYVRFVLRKHVEEIWERTSQNASHIQKLDNVLAALLKEDPERFKAVVGDCKDQLHIYLQLIQHAFERTYGIFDKAWEKTFDATYDDVMKGHEDEIIEDAVRKIVKDVYDRDLDDLGITWEDAMVRITKAVARYRAEHPDELNYGEHIENQDDRFKGESFIEVTDDEDKDKADGDDDDKAKVLDRIPEGKTPRDIVKVYIDLLNEKAKDSDVKGDWIDAWDGHYEELIAENDDFNEEFRNKVKEAYEDEEFKPKCEQINVIY